MIDLDMLEIKPHPARALVKKHKIPLIKVARFLGVSYFHASHILTGHYAPSRKVKPKLEKLFQHLKEKENER